MTGPSEQAGAGGSRAYRAGVAVAVVTSFLTVWVTIVREDGNAIGFFMLIMAAVVGAFSAWFQAAGMARTMLGVAIMQILLAVAVATDPSTVNTPDEPFRALLFCGLFTALWLISAAFFRVAAKRERKADGAH